MGKADIAVKNWLSDNDRFADLFNGTIFGGRQIVRPEELENMDRETDIIVTDKEKKSRGMQRHRDVVKRWKKGLDLAVLACEAQNEIHYARPVRNMTQDGISYTEQIRLLWQQRKKERRNGQQTRKLTGEEYLSRFGKDDRIFPVITIVFYYDVKKWDGAVELYDMFRINKELKDEKILEKYIPNYRINLVDAGNIKHLEQFGTDLQQVFGMLKCRGEQEKLQKYIQENRNYFENVDVETYQAVRVFLQSETMLKEVPVMEKEEKINMCRAMEEWYADAVREGMAKGIEDGRQIGRKIGHEEGRAEGREEGRAEGRAEGREEGRAEGREEGRKQEKTNIIVKMLEGGMPVEEIKKFTGGTEEEIEQARLGVLCGQES